MIRYRKNARTSDLLNPEFRKRPARLIYTFITYDFYDADPIYPFQKSEQILKLYL